MVEWDTLCATGSVCAITMLIGIALGELRLTLVAASAGIAVTGWAMIRMGHEIQNDLEEIHNELD